MLYDRLRGFTQLFSVSIKMKLHIRIQKFVDKRSERIFWKACVNVCSHQYKVEFTIHNLTQKQEK
jgi:hypothetical protein